MNSLKVRSDVLTYYPIPARGAYNEASFLVGQAHCGAVDLHFGGVAGGAHLGSQSRVALFPRAQLLSTEGVREREHGPLMAVLGQGTGRDGADALGRTVRSLELGMFGLDCLELAEQTVVLRVGNFRCVVDVIGVIGAIDLLAKTGDLLCGRHGGENNRAQVSR